jgi:uncharacterized protein YjdB
MRNAALRLAAALAVALAASLAACSGDDKPGPVAVTGVAVSPPALTMGAGGPARPIAAAVSPTGASQAVEWSSSNPAVANVNGSGATVTVAPLTIGEATITARSAADQTKAGTCLVRVVEAVPATRLLLPAAVTIAAGTQGNNLSADVWPAAASLMGVDWQSSDPTVVTVSGYGPTAALAGVGVGTSTITATSVGSPAATATCTVTVAGYVYREVYAPVLDGLLVNGEFAYEYGKTYAVAAVGGAVHAAVYDYDVWEVAYYRDGARVAVLPPSPGFEEFEVTSIHVTHDNRAYIVGYENHYDWDIYQRTTRARLYVVDGSTVTAVPLGGLDDWYYSDARAVYAAGGDVYVCGSLSEDGHLVNGVALWVNGKLHVYSDLVRGNPTCLTTMGADLYMGGEMWGVVKIDPSGPGAFQNLGYEDADFVEMAVRSICAVGDDIYAAGFGGGDRYDSDRAYLWRNHVREELPWDPTCWEWLEWPCAHAHAVTVGCDGAVYVLGSEIGIWNGNRLHRPVLWKNGDRRAAMPIDDPEGGFSAYYEPLRTVAVKEVSGVAVAGVGLSPAALEMAVFSSETLTATISPGNASNRSLTWTNSNPAAVLLASNGNVATVEALAPGRATITVASPDGPSASCVIDAVAVPVTDVMASPGTLEVGRGRLATIAAAVAPFNATNKSVAWTSQNPSIVEVVGAVDQRVSVKGVSAGTAGVTVTTADGGFTSTCTVTVVESNEPAIYMVGSFGMFIDGVPHLGLDAVHNWLHDVAVDAAGNVHAVGGHTDNPGSYYYRASYYRNGARTPLPLTFADTPDSLATGMALDANGDVYIVGYESNPWQHARLWKVAATGGAVTQIPLQGIYDGVETVLPSEARAVRLHDGHVYVAGYLEYLTDPNNEWSGAAVSTVWRDGVNHPCVDPADPYGYYPFKDLAITGDGYAYIVAEAWQLPLLYRAPISNLSDIERVNTAGAGAFTMNRILASGNSYYVVGRITDDDGAGTAYVWTNGQGRTLPGAPDGTQSDATSAFLFEGQLYIGGSVIIGDWDYFHTGLWIGSGADYQYIGDARAVPDDWPNPDYAAARGIFAKR